jgi:hypothetical protein
MGSVLKYRNRTDLILLFIITKAINQLASSYRYAGIEMFFFFKKDLGSL